MKLFVEGGGDVAALKSACRKGFTEFLAAAGVLQKPRVVPCGTRRNAYEQFRFAMQAGERSFLLVDSETLMAPENQEDEPENWRPWRHLKARPGDGWDKPASAEDRHCHLMVQCMESWLLADPDTLGRFFGQGFSLKSLPNTGTIETIDKVKIYAALASATKTCKTKAAYGKGEHSFKLLALIDPAKVSAASPWAKRFIDELRRAP